jgi:hypothetical protein
MAPSEVETPHREGLRSPGGGASCFMISRSPYFLAVGIFVATVLFSISLVGVEAMQELIDRARVRAAAEAVVS